MSVLVEYPRAVGRFYLRGYLAWKRGDEAAVGNLLRRTVEARDRPGNRGARRRRVALRPVCTATSRLPCRYLERHLPLPDAE